MPKSNITTIDTCPHCRRKMISYKRKGYYYCARCHHKFSMDSGRDLGYFGSGLTKEQADVTPFWRTAEYHANGGII